MTEWELAHRPLCDEIRRGLDTEGLATDGYTVVALHDNIEGVNGAINHGLIDPPPTRRVWIKAILHRFKANS